MRPSDRRPYYAARTGHDASGRPDDPIAEIRRAGDVTTVVLRGELDLRNARAIEEAIVAEAERLPARLVVDLSAVEFVDSSALSLLVIADRRLSAQGSQLVLASPSKPVWRSFVVTNLDAALLFEGAPAD